MNGVSMYDPAANVWSDLPPMLVKRGRHAVAVKGRHVYAVAGSSGQTETHTAERYDADSGQWNLIAGLPAPISNIGEFVEGVF